MKSDSHFLWEINLTILCKIYKNIKSKNRQKQDLKTEENELKTYKMHKNRTDWYKSTIQAKKNKNQNYTK